jgi:hypothetical protein
MTILRGHTRVGIYPLLEDDSCHFLAIDFDEAEWREDAQGFMQSCTELHDAQAVSTRSTSMPSSLLDRARATALRAARSDVEKAASCPHRRA